MNQEPIQTREEYKRAKYEAELRRKEEAEAAKRAKRLKEAQAARQAQQKKDAQAAKQAQQKQEAETANRKHEGEAAKQTRETRHKEAVKQKQEASSPAAATNKRGRIRLFPIWLRVLLLAVFMFISLTAGAVVGYGVIGNGKVADVFKESTWTHIRDLVEKK